MTRIIVAGGRDFNDYSILYLELNKLLEFYCGDIEIVSGTAKGADRLGEVFARNEGLPVHRFPANWDLHGKSAGYKRNVLMAENAEVLLAFWDGESKGTKHMIDIATSKGLKVNVVNY